MCTTNFVLKLYPQISMSQVKSDTRPKKATVTAADQASNLSIQTVIRDGASINDSATTCVNGGGLHAMRNFPRPPPALILRQEVQNYFREAQRRLDVNIYQCECWGADGLVYLTVPFSQRITIGIQAAAKAFMLANGVTERLGVEELQGKFKSFKWMPPSLGLKFIQMNVFGAPRQGPPVEFRLYNEVVVANIPARGDRFVKPNPTKNWLEMYAQEADAKKRKLRTTDEHTHHISTLEVEAKDAKKEAFHILVDDVLYGPFAKIKIGGCINSKEPLSYQSFPMMTYFPTDL